MKSRRILTKMPTLPSDDDGLNDSNGSPSIDENDDTEFLVFAPPRNINPEICKNAPVEIGRGIYQYAHVLMNVTHCSVIVKSNAADVTSKKMLLIWTAILSEMEKGKFVVIRRV